MSVTSFQITSPASCASLSQSRSHQLVALGCYDRNIHIMQFGDGNLITKLEGSAAAVSSVTFDKEQERVVGGCEDGGVRVWDLKSSSSIRTLGNSHKDIITSVDYHPYGDFVATASRDACMRIWDMRRKTSLQSYKDSPADLRVCKFVPSGKWVVSGCSQGTLRLYDLGSGKELNKFEAHKGAITSIAFHPEQFLMAATSEDGTMSLWNLEEQKKVYQSNPMAAPYSAVQFVGKGLMAANQRLLRLYDFKAMGDSKARNVSVGWDKLHDLAYAAASDDALAVECRGSTVAMYRIPCRGESVSPPPQHVAVAAPTPRQEYQAQRVVREPLGPKPTKVEPTREHQAQPEHAPLTRINSARAAIPLVPSTAGPSPSTVEEDSVVDALDTTSTAMTSVLGRRVTHLRVCRQMWPDIRGVLAHLQRVLKEGSDGGTLNDFMTTMQHQRIKERITIEVLPETLALVASVISSQKVEGPLLTAIRVARSLNNKFRQRIDDALKGAAYHSGVDISMEARIALSRKAQMGFEEIYYSVGQFAQRTDQLGEEARGLLTEVPRPAR